MLGYLEEVLPRDMTLSTRTSWSTFVAALTDALADALERQERVPAAVGRQRAYTSAWVEVRTEDAMLEPCSVQLVRGKTNNALMGSMNCQRAGRLRFIIPGRKCPKASANWRG